MNTGAIGAFQPGAFAGAQRPQPEAIASRMAEGLESGRIDAEKLAGKLEKRFGAEAATAFNEDGSVNVENLTALLKSAPPKGGRPDPAEIASRTAEGLESGRIDAAEFSARLEQRFGAEAASAFNEDGSLNVDGLTALLETAGSETRPGGRKGFGGFGGRPEGVVDPQALLTRLEDIFGEAANDVLNEDGSINIEQLKSLLSDNLQNAGSSGVSTGLLANFRA